MLYIQPFQNDEPPPLEEITSDSTPAPQPGPNDSTQPDSEVDDFPLEHLTKLDDQLNRPKWVVPVRPDDDLERLLRASIKLCREGGFIGYEGGYCTYTLVVESATLW